MVLTCCAILHEFCCLYFCIGHCCKYCFLCSYLLCFLFSFHFYLFFLQIMHPNFCFPSLNSPHFSLTCPLSHIHFSSHLPQEMSWPPISEHGTTRYTKTRHKLSQQAWSRQPGRQESVNELGKEQEISPTSTVRSPPKHQTNNPSIYVENLVKTNTGSVIITSVSVIPHEPCLVDSIGHTLQVSWTPLAPKIPSTPLLKGSPSSDVRDPLETSNLVFLSA